jgi:hypothetical protein
MQSARIAYLSGPMTGLPEFNFPEFNRVAALWREKGYRVFNPAENHNGVTTLDRPVYMRTDIEQLLQAEIVVVLDGWEQSVGARLEVAIARELGLLVMDNDGADVGAGNVLDEATATVMGPRREKYGHPLKNHTRTADLWKAYLGIDISPRQVCMMNILQKISRDAHVEQPDNLTDIAGYALNAEMCHAAP